MKYLLIIVIIAIAAVMVIQSDVLTPEPGRVYKAYREKLMAAQGYSSKVTASTKWSIKINKCEIEATKAVIMATEHTSKIPMNAASHAFAIKVTREIRAVLFLQNGKWRVGRESVLKENTSTYEDRQKTGNMQ